MKGLKIKPIRNILEIRETFDFFKGSFLHMTETEASVFLPMHEIYQTMVDNLDNKYKIQYYASIDDKVVGCVIGLLDKAIPNEMFLPVIAVDYKLRNSGIASKLLNLITKKAKSYKINRLKVNSSESSSGFFEKNGFNIYLYITSYSPHTLQDIKNANENHLEIINENEEDLVIKFIAPKIDNRLLIPFKRKLKDFESEFIMEKRI